MQISTGVRQTKYKNGTILSSEVGQIKLDRKRTFNQQN